MKSEKSKDSETSKKLKESNELKKRNMSKSVLFATLVVELEVKKEGSKVSSSLEFRLQASEKMMKPKKGPLSALERLQQNIENYVTLPKSCTLVDTMADKNYDEAHQDLRARWKWACSENLSGRTVDVGFDSDFPDLKPIQLEVMATTIYTESISSGRLKVRL